MSVNEAVLVRKNQELSAQNSILQRELERFQRNLSSYKLKISDSEIKLSNHESKMSSQETELSAVRDRLASTQDKLSSTKDELSETQEALEEETRRADKYAAEYERMVQVFKQARREKYGKKSEVFLEDGGMRQQPLFASSYTQDAQSETGEAEKNGTGEKEDIEYITYTRAKKEAKKGKAVCIPTREVIIRVDESERQCECGKEKETIRYEQTERLNYQPAVFEIVIEKREVVACRKGCAGSIQTAEAPKRILPKCKAAEALLAKIAVSKVLDRQPLYHLEQQIERRYDWRIPRQTMARWLIQLSDKLQPLINLMKDELIGYDVAFADATSLQVLMEPGRKAEIKSNAYCIRGGPPGKEVTVYEYNAYSHREYVKEVFQGFKGIIHSDADKVYDEIKKEDGIRLSYCHAHARRKFEQVYQATKKKGGLAKQALRYYQDLYRVERLAKEHKMSSDERLRLRQEKSREILEKFKEWLDYYQQVVLPKSPIGKAIAYSLNHWDGLLVYLEDGRVEIDNNGTEREIKPFVIARKNFLFSCTQAGADALGVHFSLILTAQKHGLNPITYYKAIFEKIPYCQSWNDYQALLPWNIKPSL